jgi:hypothetical protein
MPRANSRSGERLGPTLAELIDRRRRPRQALPRHAGQARADERCCAPSTVALDPARVVGRLDDPHARTLAHPRARAVPQPLVVVSAVPARPPLLGQASSRVVGRSPARVRRARRGRAAEPGAARLARSSTRSALKGSQ